MGREWYWNWSFRKGEKEIPGCMSGVLHFFDFHQFRHASESQQPQEQVFNTDPPQPDPAFLKGLEAPRNSLDLDGNLLGGYELSSAIKEDDIPIGIRLVTMHPNGMERDSSSDSGSFQGSRTPNLVARLMGLDLLPDQMSSPRVLTGPSPSPSHLKSHQSRKPLQIRDTNFIINDTKRYEMGTRSLPDTPRISSARRSDVDARLSLQLNKENIDIGDFNSSPFSARKGVKKEGNFYNDVNKSPSRCAREIVKQVKESVSRRVPIDITNTNNNRSKNKCSDASNDLTFNVRNTRRPTKLSNETSQSYLTTLSSSPRLRFLDSKSKTAESKELPKPSPKPRSSPSISSSPFKEAKECTKNKSQPLPRLTVKCKKDSCERFTQIPKKPPLNVDKKCKAIRIHAPQSPNTAQTLAQTAVPLQLSSTTSPSYEAQPQRELDHRDDHRRSTVTVGGGADFRYVREILDRTGVQAQTPVSFARWFSPSHPVDPIVFHRMENALQFQDQPTWGPLKHRCNRRLLFHLVDEILRDTLKPHLNMRPWTRARRTHEPHMTGKQLLILLSGRVRRYPLTNCETQQDIDALVERDLSAADMPWAMAEEESESIAVAIEQRILDSLLYETLLM